MCRNIKTLFNFHPPATDEEIREASLQFVRKLSGFSKLSQVNEKVFNETVGLIAKHSKQMLDSLTTNAEHKNRDIESKRAHERAVKRFGLT